MPDKCQHKASRVRPNAKAACKYVSNNDSHTRKRTHISPINAKRSHSLARFTVCFFALFKSLKLIFLLILPPTLPNGLFRPVPPSSSCLSLSALFVIGGRACSTVPALKVRSSRKFSRSFANLTSALSKSKSESPLFVVGSTVPFMGIALTVMDERLLLVLPLLPLPLPSRASRDWIEFRASRESRERRLKEELRECRAAPPRGALPRMASGCSSSLSSAMVLSSTGGRPLGVRGISGRSL